MNEPTSLLTRLRPDIWQRTISLATDLTGLMYLPKVPLSDGTIYACGGGAPYAPTPKEIKKRRKEEREEQQRRREDAQKTPEELREELKEIERSLPQLDVDVEKERPRAYNKRERANFRIGELRYEISRRCGAKMAAPILIPEGAVEWLLHEAGHWLAATPEERRLPNYGLTDGIAGVEAGFQKIVVPHDFRAEREWQAWAFEEIVLAPWGPSRLFVPPTQADGVAFSKADPIPARALAHAERQMRANGVDVDAWRAVFGEWIRFEQGLAAPAWQRTN